MPTNPLAARYQEVEIRTATPTELVVLMYNSAIASLQQAREFIRAGNIAGRARSLNKVSSILTELQATLNFEAGGEIARSLDRLYHYMRNRLFEAAVHQDAAAVEEVARLMAHLRPAWIEVARTEAGSRSNPVHSEPSPVPSSIAASAEPHMLSGLSVKA
jgi:flagellar protein FliS